MGWRRRFDDKDLLDEKDQRKNVMALAVLRHHIIEDVLEVIAVGEEMERASIMLKSLKQVFMAKDVRTKLQVQRDLLSCDMRMGESLMSFLGRINRLISELGAMEGKQMDEKLRMVTIASRLRLALREAAHEKMDREEELSYAKLVSYLMAKIKSERESTGEVAYVATGEERGAKGLTRLQGQGQHQQRGSGRGSQQQRGGRQGGRGMARGGRLATAGCNNCGAMDHWQDQCPRPLICH